MKILHTVEFYYPSLGGSQEVVRQLSERMVEAGHDVTVATTDLPERKNDILNGVKILGFNISGNEVRGYKGDTKSYQDFLVTTKFDVVMNYAAQEWTADLTYPLLGKLVARKIFVPCGFSALYDPAYRGYFEKMPEVLNQYDATIYMADSYRDIDFARAHNVNNLHIIPNGANEAEFLEKYNGNIREELSIRPSTKLILHVGGFTGQKGQSEAIKIFQSARLRDATLLLIGNKISKKIYANLKRKAFLFNVQPTNRRNRRQIIILELERAQTVAAFKSADVFLFPSNIEASPLVLFEACAAQTPFLTTDVGNAREIIERTHGGILLPTTIAPDGLAHADILGSAKVLRKLISNDKQLLQLAADGYAAWNNKYRWDKIANKYLRLYKGQL